MNDPDEVLRRPIRAVGSGRPYQERLGQDDGGMGLIERPLLADIGQKVNFDFTRTGLAFTLQGAPTKETAG